MTGNVLSLKHVSKVYRVAGGVNLFALSDVELTIQRGELLGLVGLSGTGKSTLARLAARLEKPTAGSVELDGRNIWSGWTAREYRRRVQLILQDSYASLNPAHTVGYHLRRAVVCRRPTIVRAAKTALVEELLGRVDLETGEAMLRKYPHELAGGERQRVALARAMAADPAILFADEPISMVDSPRRVDLLRLLTTLTRKNGIAVVLITHDIAAAANFARPYRSSRRRSRGRGCRSDLVVQTPAEASRLAPLARGCSTQGLGGAARRSCLKR